MLAPREKSPRYLGGEEPALRAEDSGITTGLVPTCTASSPSSSPSSSSFHSSGGNSSLLDEGGSASQVPQATVELAGYGSVVWPDSLSE